MAQPNWLTPAGSIGTFPANIFMTFDVVAQQVLPAYEVTYQLISGTFPAGITINETGTISGTPTTVLELMSYSFTIRATDNLGFLRDRTFSLSISGFATPTFTTPPGIILSISDSVWIETQIEYSNPTPSEPVIITLISGQFPPGLAITTTGIIHGYAEPPLATVPGPYVETELVATTATTNIITCTSTDDFFISRPIVFTGAVFGGLVSGTTYYITSVISNTTFTISSTNNGQNFILANGSGFGVDIALPAVSVGLPTITTSTFSLKITTAGGNSSQTYSITVINQNTPTGQGGPGNPANTRIPTIFNTRPSIALITNSDPYYGYYVFPDSESSDYSYPPEINAHIGTIRSDNYFSFKIIGHDFDGTELTYQYAGLPAGLTGNSLTGWITGTPTLALPGINQWSFSVAVNKIINPSIQSRFFKFDYYLSNTIDGIITWTSPDRLGNLYNGEICTLSVAAECDVELEFRILEGELPPNLVLSPSGQIIGSVAYQPTADILLEDQQTEFSFMVEAFSPQNSIVKSTNVFTILVTQLNTPTDTLYIKATPNIRDRQIIETLLTNTTLIPDEDLYRIEDPNFGKAREIIYPHLFGIEANSIDQYLAAITTKNHYWRNITLGELATAVAKDANGEIVYEVVYSKIIDNLQNPTGTSISKEIIWPRLIDLSLGPWYTSITDIYTSYDDILGQEYYTSLTPGYARTLYPNSLFNMRAQVSTELGQEQDTRVLPLWMTSQQNNGSTLGYTQAWVICYTKPGQSTTIMNNINANWKQPIGLLWKLNMIDFKIDRFFVDKQLTYNYNNITVPASWTGLPSATPVPDPRNSKDFYALFPRRTILPNETQY